MKCPVLTKSVYHDDFYDKWDPSVLRKDCPFYFAQRCHGTAGSSVVCLCIPHTHPADQRGTGGLL